MHGLIHFRSAVATLSGLPALLVQNQIICLRHDGCIIRHTPRSPPARLGEVRRQSTVTNAAQRLSKRKQVCVLQVEFAVNDGTDAFHCQTLPCAYEYGGINSPVRRA